MDAACHRPSEEAAPCSHLLLETVAFRFFQRIAARGDPPSGESGEPSNTCRKGFFTTCAKKVNASQNEINFTLSSILRFKQNQELHTANRKPAEKRRVRPNYRNERRRFLAQRPLERRRHPDWTKRGVVADDVSFTMLTHFCRLLGKARMVSRERVLRLIAAGRCRCKVGDSSSTSCYARFAAVLDELVQFLALFWNLRKVLQDAYAWSSIMASCFESCIQRFRWVSVSFWLG